MVRLLRGSVLIAVATIASCAGQQTEDSIPKGSQDAGTDSPTVLSDSGIFPSNEGGPCKTGDVGACYTGPPSSQNVGVCKDGKTTCDSGTWGACLGEVVPGIEVCNELDDDCNGSVDEGCSCVDGKTRICYSGASGTDGNGPCKAGIQTCAGGKWPVLCVGEVTPAAETCNGVDDDCDGKVDDGNPGGGAKCSTKLPGVCSAGSMTCVSSKLSCTPITPSSSEKCNLADDDCDGSCDEGAGCRVGVHRSWSSSKVAHLYTTNLSEAQSGGYALEVQNFYYLYKASQPGMKKFYKCLKANGKHFYTQSSACEGGGTSQGSMGYIGTAASCGSTPLYRLFSSSSSNHFYAVTTGERDYAVSIGYKYESIAGYVWKEP